MIVTVLINKVTRFSVNGRLVVGNLIDNMGRSHSNLADLRHVVDPVGVCDLLEAALVQLGAYGNPGHPEPETIPKLTLTKWTLLI